jgi:hypothetical protein
MPKAVSDIAAPIILRFLHIPSKNEIRRAGTLAQFAQARRGGFRRREIPILGDGHVIEPRGSCCKGEIRKIQGERWLPRPMNHVDMVVAAVPPEAAQASLGSQPKHQRHSLPRLQLNRLLGSPIVKPLADSNDCFSGRDILLEMAD